MVVFSWNPSNNSLVAVRPVAGVGGGAGGASHRARSQNTGGLVQVNAVDAHPVALRSAVADFHLLNLEALEELDRLDCEIYEETEIKNLLQNSCRDLAITIEELEKRLEEIENEGSEWKTRFLNQSEMNQMLERQVILLANQIEDTKLLLKDGNVAKIYADLSDSGLQKSIKSAQKEKKRLETEIKELEIRIEQEAKAFHKANEERRQLLNETKQAVMARHQKSQLDLLKTDLKRLHQMSTRAQIGAGAGTGTGAGTHASNAPNQPTIINGPGNYGHGKTKMSTNSSNVPPNQRILDPRKGPIKKAAAVKRLPALAIEHSAGSSSG